MSFPRTPVASPHTQDHRASMSGAGSLAAPPAAPAAAPAAAPPASSFKPSNELMELMKGDKWLQTSIAGWETLVNTSRDEVKSTRKELERIRKATKIAPTVKDCLADLETVDEMKKLALTLKAVNKAGGIDEIMKMKKFVEDYEKKKADAAAEVVKVKAHSSKRSELNKTYRATLEKYGLVSNNLYRVKWSNLVDHNSKDKLPPSYSFVIVLGSCELPEKNMAADPSKVRVRLAFIAHDCVNELYMDWQDDPDFFVLVQKSNLQHMHDCVLSDFNVALLHAADGANLSHYDTYKDKLTSDSLRAIKSYVKDSFGFFAGCSQSAGKRPRADVNYAEKRQRISPRSRSAASEEAEVEVVAEVVDEDDDNEDVVVSSLARP